MSETRAPGRDRAATLGGPGWRVREGTLAADIADGRLWRRCGVTSEVAPLRHVLLSWPGAEMSYREPANAWLMHARPTLARLQRQVEGVVAAYRAEGVEVTVHRPVGKPSPNHVFLRDLFFMTPEGAILSRMAAAQRAGEERQAALALSRLGVPILATVRGRGTFEGADALWLDARTVLLGVGRRTNEEGAAQVTRLLQALGVTTHRVPVPVDSQHLLGILDFIDVDLVAVRRGAVDHGVLALFDRRGIRRLELPANVEVMRRRAMNFVTLAPRRILMPTRCPKSRRLYESEGITCVEIEVGEYLKAAGGPGCITGIIYRD